MVLNTLDVTVVLLCLSLSALLYYTGRFGPCNQKRPGAGKPAQGYILQNEVTHARLLPPESSHAFTYPTISLLVSLNALESHLLDLGCGRLFGYGGLWGRLVGIRSHPYLGRTDGRSIKERLEGLLKRRGHMNVAESLEDAWLMTMPSFIGFEGINPLTVYFCFKEQRFWATVLEIHNTFGESHVHVLEINKHEDEHISKGFDHQWTFCREFHVSPFNDRSGFYTVSVKSPSHSPTSIPNDRLKYVLNPKPSVRVHLFTASESDSSSPGLLKLTALLRPTSSTPLTSASLLLALAKAPLGLLLTMPRILYGAWVLHYIKHLDLYLKPEPFPADGKWKAALPFSDQKNFNIGGGVKWLDEGLLEKYARFRLEAFFSQQVEESGIKVSLIPANPDALPRTFTPAIWGEASDSKYHLQISYLSPRFFTFLFLCPSAEHALLLGSDTENQFFVSSRQLFINIFSPTVSEISPGPSQSTLQTLRLRAVPPNIPIPVPPSHPLDDCSTFFQLVTSFLIIRLHFVLDSFEALVMRLAHARVVAGQEPWFMWQRASKMYFGEFSRVSVPLGSVRSNHGLVK